MADEIQILNCSQVASVTGWVHSKPSYSEEPRHGVSLVHPLSNTGICLMSTRAACPFQVFLPVFRGSHAMHLLLFWGVGFFNINPVVPTLSLGIFSSTAHTFEKEVIAIFSSQLVNTSENLSKSRKILRSMSRKVITNKLLLSIVILLELVILGVLIYYKFFHKH